MFETVPKDKKEFMKLSLEEMIMRMYFHDTPAAKRDKLLKMIKTRLDEAIQNHTASMKAISEQVKADLAQFSPTQVSGSASSS